MSKKHAFLRFFAKITLFACVFCVVPAWSETTCDIDYTPVTGNSWQTGNPTPTNPVAIESIGTKVGNKYAVQIAVNYDGGVVDLGSLDWTKRASGTANERFYTMSLQGTIKNNSITTIANAYCTKYALDTSGHVYSHYADKIIGVMNSDEHVSIYDSELMNLTAEQFKQAMSGVYLYYQRTTDETWTAPTLRTVYLDDPLRKVGDYADVLDYKNGTITRNVGVKVLDGTESWMQHSTYAQLFGTQISGHYVDTSICSHYRYSPQAFIDGTFWLTAVYLYFYNTSVNSLDEWKAYLAAQYAAGTPVTVYYPLATPVVEQIENWSCTPPITDIKIATTKYVDDEFAPLNTALANAISVVDNVVTQTIAQAGQIATLQNTKQTRPSDDNECPAGKKCLLVTDENGTPHWYEIVEP